MLRELAPTSRLCRRSWRNRWFPTNSEKSAATKSPQRALIRARWTGIPDIAEMDAERQPVDALAGFLKQKCPTQEAAVQSRLQFTHMA